jgi:hypothetical protein
VRLVALRPAGCIDGLTRLRGAPKRLRGAGELHYRSFLAILRSQ